jgi:hypothetical protein
MTHCRAHTLLRGLALALSLPPPPLLRPSLRRHVRRLRQALVRVGKRSLPGLEPRRSPMCDADHSTPVNRDLRVTSLGFMPKPSERCVIRAGDVMVGIG